MNAMTKPGAIVRQLIQDIQLGCRVRVAETAQYAAEWPDEYVVVHMTWEYQDAGLDVLKEINIGIASDDEIKNRCGYTDGFSIEDLILVRL
jgi:hypothetical protein